MAHYPTRFTRADIEMLQALAECDCVQTKAQALLGLRPDARIARVNSLRNKTREQDLSRIVERYLLGEIKLTEKA